MGRFDVGKAEKVDFCGPTLVAVIALTTRLNRSIARLLGFLGGGLSTLLDVIFITSTGGLRLCLGGQHNLVMRATELVKWAHLMGREAQLQFPFDHRSVGERTPPGGKPQKLRCAL